LQLGSDGYSYFALKFNVLEYRIQEGFLWDHKYPSRPIFSESLEIRIDTGYSGTYRAGYRWLSDAQWVDFISDNDQYLAPLRQGLAVRGNIKFEAFKWEPGGEAT